MDTYNTFSMKSFFMVSINCSCGSICNTSRYNVGTFASIQSCSSEDV